MPYHIYRLKNKQYGVVLVGKNGEVLSTTESFKSKRSAFKNIAAQLKTLNYEYEGEVGIPLQYILDQTTGVVKKMYFSGLIKEPSCHVIIKPYIPGKNPSKKKSSKSPR